MTIKGALTSVVTHSRDGLGWGLQKLGSGAQYGSERLLARPQAGVIKTTARVSAAIVATTIVSIVLAVLQAYAIPSMAAVCIGNALRIPVGVVINTAFVFETSSVASRLKTYFLTPSIKTEGREVKLGHMLSKAGRWMHRVGEKCKVHKTVEDGLSSTESKVLKAAIMTMQGLVITLILPPLPMSQEAVTRALDKIVEPMMYFGMNTFVAITNLALEKCIQPIQAHKG